MASFNRVILMGNLTRDPELRYVGNNMAVSDIGLAVNDRRKSASGEWVEETTFVDVTLWGRTAEVANEYLSKGSPVLIEGRLKFDSWENKEGEKRSKLRVVGEKMQMLGGRGGGEGGGGSRSGGRSAPARNQNEYSEPADDFDSYEGGGGSQQGGSRQGGSQHVGSPSSQPPQDDDIPF